MIQPRKLRVAPASLTRNNFVALLANRPYYDGLHHALRTDRFGKLFESLGGHITAWLVTASFKLLHRQMRSEEHTSELQLRGHLVCRLLLEKKKKKAKLTVRCTVLSAPHQVRLTRR